MPLPLISVALITAIASLMTSTVNVGVGIHTAVQTAKTREIGLENQHDVSFTTLFKICTRLMRINYCNTIS